MGKTGLQVHFPEHGRLIHFQSRWVLSALRDATTKAVIWRLTMDRV